MNTQQLLALATILLMVMPAPVLGGAAKALGTAEGQGTFEVNRKAVSGTGTILPGDEITTRGNGSTVRMSGGRVDLAPQSAGILHDGRLELRSGTASVQGLGVEAGKLTIVPEANSARATVEVRNGMVNVNAQSGRVEVKNASGQLVARVMPGKPLAFTPAAGATGRRNGLVLHGTMESARGNHFLTDETAAVKFQLSGLGLDRFAGRRVALSGHVLDGVRALDGAAGVVAVDLVQLAAYQKPAAGAGSTNANGDEAKKEQEEDSDSKKKAGAVVVGGGAAAGTGAAAAGTAGTVAGVATTTVVAGVAVAGGAVATAVVVKKVASDDNEMSLP